MTKGDAGLDAVLVDCKDTGQPVTECAGLSHIIQLKLNGKKTKAEVCNNRVFHFKKKEKPAQYCVHQIKVLHIKSTHIVHTCLHKACYVYFETSRLLYSHPTRTPESKMCKRLHTK